MKRLRLVLLAVFIVVTITALFVEILLRLLPNWYTEYGNNIFYRYTQDKHILTLEPNQAAPYRHACYRIPLVSVNAEGYRSYEWNNLAGPVRIAVLGDSFVEGKQAGENAYFAARLRGLLKQDVLNFGISGYGTIHEYLQYVRDVRNYRPKIVLLFFCTFNDVNGNACKLMGGGSLLSCAKMENGGVVIDEKKDQKAMKSIINFLYRHYKTSLFIKTVFFQHRVDPAAREKSNVLPEDYYSYMPPKGDWPEAWALTEHFLKELKTETEKDNATLIVIPVVEHIRMVKDFKAELRKAFNIEAPLGFDPEYPVRRLQEISQGNNIVFYNPEPFFRRYRDEFNLPEPYFAYRCEGHWNPLTHYLMANLAAEYLIKNGYLDNNAALKEAQSNLRRTPKEILGDAGYKEIYEGGFYNCPAR
ncbi:MAG: SGNH/GDSL hydrolase family protein [Candidatus Magnetominusculus sp. LBB02]|nr:SGNH/GDSL hydrolase family protein [Candidatus Magnetominusculus sp. LBB02]